MPRERVLHLHVLIFLGLMLSQPMAMLRMGQPMVNPSSTLRIVTTLHPPLKLKEKLIEIRTWSMSLWWR